MSAYSQALNYAASFCSSSEHCQSEVLEKIKRFELTPEEQNQLVSRLKSEHFLDEQRFVKAFVNDKFRYSKWGKTKISYMLRQKGLSSSLIEEGLSLILDESYQDMLTDLLKQKKRSVKAATPYELKGKLFRFAAGKGFESSVISLCLKKMGMEEDDE
jgi:regulatory protein